MFGANADFFTCANLVSNVNSGCWIFADTHRGQPGTNVHPLDRALNIQLDPRCQLRSFKFDHKSGHKKAQKTQTRIYSMVVLFVPLCGLIIIRSMSFLRVVLIFIFLSVAALPALAQ